MEKGKEVGGPKSGETGAREAASKGWNNDERPARRLKQARRRNGNPAIKARLAPPTSPPTSPPTCFPACLPACLPPRQIQIAPAPSPIADHTPLPPFCCSFLRPPHLLSHQELEQLVAGFRWSGIDGWQLDAWVLSGLMMHPPLTLHKHPACAELIVNFKKCHEDHPVQKFFGACNDLKIQLDKCFREEKQVKRKANFEASKQFKEKLRASKAAKSGSETTMPASA